RTTYTIRRVILSYQFLHPPPPRPTLFPYTTLFRSHPILLYRQILHFPMEVRGPFMNIALFAHDKKNQFIKELNSNSRNSNWRDRSEEHTSELQSRFDLVCRLLLEKKKIDNGTGLRV